MSPDCLFMTMKNTALIILSILANFTILTGLAQTSPEVSKPILGLQDSFITISYDITNCTEKDTFRVWIQVSDDLGNPIKCTALSGDIGENISGSSGKQIKWDYRKDSLMMTNEIAVQLFAEMTSREPIEPTISPDAKRINTGGILIRSAIFPGWGFEKMDKSNLHLAKGVAAYAFLASAIVLNRKAVDSYKLYDESFNIEDSKKYIQTSERQDNLSEAFGWTAVGIWSAELIWILVELKSDQKNALAERKSLSFQPGYDVYAGKPIMTVVYRF
jgi:hypothetical protein